MNQYSLGRSLDDPALAMLYASRKRLQIPGFLAPDAATALYRYLADSEDWRLSVNKGDTILDFRAETLAAFSDEKRDKLDRAVALGGRYGFQFRYDSLRLPKNGGAEPAPATPLQDFERFLSSPDLIALLRTVTGADDISFADAHASRYLPGHFLTAHDDAIEGMGRRAAYVLNLSPEWRADWGGLLLFHDDQGNIASGFTPAFNMLNIFAVPHAHSVSWVTPLAGAPRYAVTGWLRADETATERR